MKVNYVIVANCFVANMSFNANRENKILAKISELTLMAAYEERSSTVVESRGRWF